MTDFTTFFVLLMLIVTENNKAKKQFNFKLSRQILLYNNRRGYFSSLCGLSMYSCTPQIVRKPNIILSNSAKFFEM